MRKRWTQEEIKKCWESELTLPVSTACKHGRDECELCGTTNRRDVIHVTINGKGKIGQVLMRRK